MKPKMPVYQPVQRPEASLNWAAMSLAFGATYASSRPSLPSGSWNSLDPPMKMSAFGLAFSVRMRVWSSPAAASGRTFTVTFGYAFLNASKNWLLVVSFSAEYTEIVPVTGAAVGAVLALAVPAALGLGLAVAAPPHAATAAVTPASFRNVRRS